MRINWLIVILLINWLPVWGGSPDSVPSSSDSSLFQFSLAVQADGLFIPGDKVTFTFSPKGLDTNSTIIEVQLPAGLELADPLWLWQPGGRTASRTIFTKDSLVNIITLISQDFSGRQLTVSANYADAALSFRKSVTISVAEILSNKVDTCFFIQDTTNSTIRTILSTRRKVTARLRGPIDLSPTAPLLVSNKGCKVFILEPGKKQKKQKNNCTILHFSLTGDTAEDYPPRLDPDSNKAKNVFSFNSNSNIGDSLVVSLSTIEGKLLKNVTLTDDNMLLADSTGEILDAQTDVLNYKLTKVLDTDTLNHTLYLRGRPGQYILLDVERWPAIVTLYRDNGSSAHHQSAIDTLLREVVEKNGTLIRSKMLITHRVGTHTEFYRILETIDMAGVLPPRRDTLSRDISDGQYSFQLEKQPVIEQKWVAVDTLMYQATDVTETVVGERNPLGRRRAHIEVKVPLQLDAGGPDTKDILIAIAYWIGIGESPIAAYAALAEEVPPEWAQPGISPPLAAYGLAHPIILPGLPNSDTFFQKDQISFYFVDRPRKKPFFVEQRGEEPFARNMAYTPLLNNDPNYFNHPKHPNYNLLDGLALQDLYKAVLKEPKEGKRFLHFYLAFANQHAINTYQVQLNVIAYYRVFARQDTLSAAQPKP